MKAALAGYLLASLLAFSPSSDAQRIAAPPATPAKAATAKRYMVAASHPLAVEAGLKVLERGGNAIDAMVATQLVLGLVEPASSGLGGGSFLLYYDAKKAAIRAYDGRETAPAGATAALFMRDEGVPMDFAEARGGGRPVGTPGTPRLLELAHVRHGKLPWATLFEPAIALAEKGFPIAPALAGFAQRDKALASEPSARAYFFAADGSVKPAGTILRNPEFAATLRTLARHGADAFYTGEIARDIVAAVRGHRNPGTLSLEDLAGYRVREVEAICGPYRRWKVCGMPPSSSGGIAVLQILGALSRFDMASVPPQSAQAVHLMSEAQRLAFADRNRYVADDRFADVPTAGLVDPSYVAGRARLIDPRKSMRRAEAGAPAGARVAYADDAYDEIPGTSHFTIVDREGNVVSMTTTIEAVFGSRLMVRGFLLNNELTDFSFLPVEGGGPVANRVEPGKRPRSSMAPTLVFDARGRTLEMAVGSPGGSNIIGYVTQALVATLDWKMPLQAAVALPHYGSRNGPTEVEKGTELEGLQAALNAMGHEVRAVEMLSGLYGIRRTSSGWEGGADPRRAGVARGR